MGRSGPRTGLDVNTERHRKRYGQQAGLRASKTHKLNGQAQGGRQQQESGGAGIELTSEGSVCERKRRIKSGSTSGRCSADQKGMRVVAWKAASCRPARWTQKGHGPGGVAERLARCGVPARKDATARHTGRACLSQTTKRGCRREETWAPNCRNHHHSRHHRSATFLDAERREGLKQKDGSA